MSALARLDEEIKLSGGYNGNLSAIRKEVSELVDAARKFRDQYEREADAREDFFLVDPGCVICTSGATPHNFDTGICGYHATCNALAAFARIGGAA